MNNDLISRSAAVELLRDKAQHYTVSMFATSGECYVAKVVATESAAEIANMPAVDAEPVRHGRWIPQDATFTRFMCSACKSRNHAYCTDYCPDCGAKMDAEERERYE